MSKVKQLEVILKTNPMLDDYHVGIRKIEDILTFQEAKLERLSEGYGYEGLYGDFEEEDVDEAIKNGEVKIYSSKPITVGNFVSTSRNMALDYSGKRNPYTKFVKLTEVAWIDIDEGIYTGKLSII